VCRPRKSTKTRSNGAGTLGRAAVRLPHHLADHLKCQRVEYQVRPFCVCPLMRTGRQAREAAKGQVDYIRPATASRDFSAAGAAREATGTREAPAAGEHTHHGA
jgi:hypothetical protein